MLQYLIILLDQNCGSFCHYESERTENKLIPLETLKKGITFAMKENLYIQYVYPNKQLPIEYVKLIESYEHSKIVSSLCEDQELKELADAIVFHDWAETKDYPFRKEQAYILRTAKETLLNHPVDFCNILKMAGPFSVVFTNIESFSDQDFNNYHIFLDNVASILKDLYQKGETPQTNLLTDRLVLNKMNNCGAGDTNITLAPDGKLYICPGFYYDNEYSIGDLDSALEIKNKQLYKLECAPICRHCDAFQCKRCVWLNKKTTLEVNIPSHEQCVLAHIERNASRKLLHAIQKFQPSLSAQEIQQIDYLDPYDTRDSW